ncbi:hypothetical protein BC831DRAFT_474311 [Entophlyctis helioformis]|nr:hypothetical protein BC831DRAFT_474311 [Entophlyctis helioformis]
MAAHECTWTFAWRMTAQPSAMTLLIANRKQNRRHSHTFPPQSHMAFLSRVYRTFVGAGSSPATKDDNALRIGILGAANIAPNACILPLSFLASGVAYAIAARSESKAAAFAKKHGIPVVHPSYEALIADPNVDAVFIPLPNGLHHVWALAAIRAGKHVLCEKPLADNADQARSIADALAEYNGRHPQRPLVFAEAFHWKAHPLAAFLRRVVQGDHAQAGWDLGKIASVKTRFSVPTALTPLSDIRMVFELGGGATMDAGCYAVSTSRFIAQAIARTADPSVTAPTVIAAKMTTWDKDPRIDLAMDADLVYPSGLTSNVSSEHGTVTVTNFIAPSVYHAVVFARKNGSTLSEKVYGDDAQSTYYHQMKAFIGAVRGEVADFAAVGLTDVHDAIENMRVIDQIYTKAGLPVRP